MKRDTKLQEVFFLFFFRRVEQIKKMSKVEWVRDMFDIDLVDTVQEGYHVDNIDQVTAVLSVVNSFLQPSNFCRILKPGVDENAKSELREHLLYWQQKLSDVQRSTDPRPVFQILLEVNNIEIKQRSRVLNNWICVDLYGEEAMWKRYFEIEKHYDDRVCQELSQELDKPHRKLALKNRLLVMNSPDPCRRDSIFNPIYQ